MTTMTVRNVEQNPDGSTSTSALSESVPSSASFPWAALGTFSVATAAVLMWYAFSSWVKPTPIAITTGYVPFAGVFVVTAALERLLEPLGLVLKPPSAEETSKASASKAHAQAAAGDPSKPDAQVRPLVAQAARDQAVIDRKKADRTIWFWAIASVCGLGISGGFGFFLLQTIAAGKVNHFLDLAVTGLTIGAGTKPLHDLVTTIQGKSSSSSTTT